MTLDELKERVSNEWQKSTEKLEENRIYVEVQNRYENLTPIQQKLLLGGVIGAALIFLFSIPFSYYSLSDESLTQFSETRQLVRDLLKTSKESKEGPDIPIPPPIDALRARIDSAIQAGQLLPEQMTGTVVEASHGGVINAQLVDGLLKVSLSRLNLKQIVDFGHEFSGLSPSVKLKDMQILASTKEPGYFDVVYQILILKVKPKEVVVEEEKPKKKVKK